MNGRLLKVRQTFTSQKSRSFPTKYRETKEVGLKDACGTLQVGGATEDGKYKISSIYDATVTPVEVK